MKTAGDVLRHLDEIIGCAMPAALAGRVTLDKRLPKLSLRGESSVILNPLSSSSSEFLKFVFSSCASEQMVITPVVTVLTSIGKRSQKPVDGLYDVVVSSRIMMSAKVTQALLVMIFDHDEKMAKLDWTPYLKLLRLASLRYSELIATLKYLTVYPLYEYFSHGLAKSFNLPPPPPPHFKTHSISKWVFTGYLQRYVRNRCQPQRRRTHDKRRLMFLQTLLQGVKRASEVVPSSFVANAMIDHMKVLSSPAPRVLDTDYLSQLKNLSLDLFKRTRIAKRIMEPSNHQLLSYEPSKRATLENNLSKGGGFSYLQSLDQFSGGPQIHTRELLGMSYTSRGGTLEYYGIDVDPLTLYEEARRVSLTGDSPSSGKVKVAAILEPFKVRLITKAESIVTFFGKPYQKIMWSSLRDLPQFALIGEPLKVEHLLKLKESSLSFYQNLNGWGEEMVWISGDYKGATDRLNIEVTKTLLDVLKALLLKSGYKSEVISLWESAEEISDGLEMPDSCSIEILRDESGKRPPVFWDILKRNLYEQEISYSTSAMIDLLNNLGYEEFCLLVSGLSWFDPLTCHDLKSAVAFFKEAKVISVRQTNGQLMGSILSFPLLCLANFLSAWLGFQDYFSSETGFSPRSNSISNFPVLINGDDILMYAPSRYYKYWVASSDKMGFVLSIGKNYVHHSLLTVNSQLWVDEGESFTLIPYINLGSLLNRSVQTEKTLDDHYRLSVVGSSDPVGLTRRFLHYHRHNVDRYTRKGYLNLFLPRSLGGIGLVAPVGYIPSFTHSQVRLSCYLEDQVRSFESGFIKMKTLEKYLSHRPHLVDTESLSEEWVSDKQVAEIWGDRKLIVTVTDSPCEAEIFRRSPNHMSVVDFLDYLKRVKTLKEPSMALLAHESEPSLQMVIPQLGPIRKLLATKRISLNRTLQVEEKEIFVNRSSLYLDRKDVTPTLDLYRRLRRSGVGNGSL